MSTLSNVYPLPETVFLPTQAGLDLASALALIAGHFGVGREFDEFEEWDRVFAPGVRAALLSDYLALDDCGPLVANTSYTLRDFLREVDGDYKAEALVNAFLFANPRLADAPVIVPIGEPRYVPRVQGRGDLLLWTRAEELVDTVLSDASERARARAVFLGCRLRTLLVATDVEPLDTLDLARRLGPGKADPDVARAACWVTSDPAEPYAVIAAPTSAAGQKLAEALGGGAHSFEPVASWDVEPVLAEARTGDATVAIWPPTGCPLRGLSEAEWHIVVWLANRAAQAEMTARRRPGDQD